MTHRTTKNGIAVQEAREAAKIRDHWTCQITFRGKDTGDLVDGAHIFVVHCPFPLFDPADPRFIVTLIRAKHRQMDAIKDHRKRAAWLRANGLPLYADRILWVIRDIEGPCP